MSDSIPIAEIRPIRRLSWAWAVPAGAVLFALFLGGMAWSARGPELTLLAAEGHGLQSGDVLSFRGIAVGEVRRVELKGDLSAVELSVRLDPAAERIARAGSRFWVVRPDIALDRLRGVETILGARHLSVLPGAPDAPVQHEFVCLEEAPVLTSIEEDVLEFTLEAPRRFGLAPGAPLTYRQIEIGSVLSVGLSSDAGSVVLRCIVRGPYRELIREDTVFWESGGFRLDFKLIEGLSVDVESLRSLLVGGISLATPTRPGPPAKTGHRFVLAPEPKEEWLGWRPALPVGSALLPTGTPTPRLLRARLVWEQGIFGRGKARSGWVLPLSNGIVGPADLLSAPEGAKDPALELRGQRLPLSTPVDAEAAGLARRGLAWPDVERWPKDRIRALGEPEDVLVVGDPGDAITALDAARLRAEDGARWRADPAISFDASWHGAVVLARSDGFLVGLLVVEDGRGSVLSLEGLL